MLIKFHQDRVKTRGVIKLQRSLRSGRAGSGRVGPGRVGPGRVGSGRVGSKFFFVDFESLWPEMKLEPENFVKIRIFIFATVEVDNLTVVRL